MCVGEKNQELTIFCSHYHSFLQRNYFNKRFLKNKTYNGKIFMCFVCMTGNPYEETWKFASSTSYEGIYDYSNHRYSGLRIFSSAKSAHQHASRYHKLLQLKNNEYFFIDLTSHISSTNWTTSYNNYCTSLLQQQFDKNSSLHIRNLKEITSKLPSTPIIKAFPKLYESPSKIKNPFSRRRNSMKHLSRTINSVILKKKARCKIEPHSDDDENDEVIWVDSNAKEMISKTNAVAFCM
jgi:hypothetical protein